MTSEIQEMDLHQFLSRPPGGLYLPGQEFLVKKLVAKLANSKNVAFAAHDGWGKTVLRKEVEYALLEQNEDIRTFHIEIKAKENPTSFLIRFTNELCESTATKPPAHQHRVSPDYKLLDLPEKIATRKRIRLVIFISNFQYTRQYKNYWDVLRRFSLSWKIHLKCTYCISGSSQYIFQELLENTTCPLQGFGNLYSLQRNQVATYTSYIRGLFLNGDKIIDASAARSIACKTDSHLFYLQLLAWHAFTKTDSFCTTSIVDDAFKNLVYHYEPHMREMRNRLTQKQLNYLLALLNHTENICSRNSLEHYKLGQSSNIARVKQSLIIKGIIEIQNGVVMIVDPLFSYWLKKHT